MVITKDDSKLPEECLDPDEIEPEPTNTNKFDNVAHNMNDLKILGFDGVSAFRHNTIEPRYVGNTDILVGVNGDRDPDVNRQDCSNNLKPFDCNSTDDIRKIMNLAFREQEFNINVAPDNYTAVNSKDIKDKTRYGREDSTQSASNSPSDFRITVKADVHEMPRSVQECSNNLDCGKDTKILDNHSKNNRKTVKGDNHEMHRFHQDVKDDVGDDKNNLEIGKDKKPMENHPKENRPIAKPAPDSHSKRRKTGRDKSNRIAKRDNKKVNRKRKGVRQKSRLRRKCKRPNVKSMYVGKLDNLVSEDTDSGSSSE